MITYLTQLTISWMILFLGYYMFLKRETFFKYNRWYLLAGLILGLLIPLVDWTSLLVHETEGLGHLYVAPMNTQVQQWDIYVSATPETPVWYRLLIGVYIAGGIFATLKLGKGIREILSLRNDAEIIRKEGYNLVLTDRLHMPFSFMSSIYWSAELYGPSGDKDRILAHEGKHVSALHSLDILFIELLCVVFWFHPMVYIYRKEIKEVHEYEADAAACVLGNKREYGKLLLNQAQSGLQLALANHFIYSQLKNRFKMMTRKPSTKRAMLKYLIAIPIIGFAALLFSFTSNENLSMGDNSRITIDTLPSSNVVSQIPPPPPAPIPKIGEILLMRGNGVRIEASDILYVNGEKVGRVTDELIQEYSDVGPWIVEIYKGKEASDLFGEDEGTGVYSIFKFVTNIKIGQDIYLGGGKFYTISASDILYIDGEKVGPANAQNVSEYISGNNSLYVNILSREEAANKFNEESGSTVIEIHRLVKSPSSPPPAPPMTEDEIKNGEIFKIVEEMPRFPGCEDTEGTPGEKKACADQKMLEFLYDNIRYPALARANGIEGNVVVSFVVEKDGSLTNLKIMRDVGGGLGEESLRVVEMMNSMDRKWIPGVQRGHKVRVQFILPVKFDLSTEKKEISADERGIVSNQYTGEVFKVVEEMPRFPGCEDMEGTSEDKKKCADRKMLEFIYKNLKYPALARENGIEGNIVVSFVVEKDGTITDPKIMRDVGAGLGEESVRVVKLMNQLDQPWIPGKQRGKDVRVQFILPVKFELKNNSKDKDQEEILDLDEFNPLIILDGTKIGRADKNQTLQTLDPSAVKSVNVLKGESAVEKYGAEGRGGAIEIYSKVPEMTRQSARLDLERFNLYPNPARNQLNVEFEGPSGAYSLEVVDVKGAILLDRDVRIAGRANEVLDISPLHSGPYYLLVKTGNQVASKIFVKE